MGLDLRSRGDDLRGSTPDGRIIYVRFHDGRVAELPSRVVQDAS